MRLNACMILCSWRCFFHKWKCFFFLYMSPKQCLKCSEFLCFWRVFIDNMTCWFDGKGSCRKIVTKTRCEPFAQRGLWGGSKDVRVKVRVVEINIPRGLADKAVKVFWVAKCASNLRDSENSASPAEVFLGKLLISEHVCSLFNLCNHLRLKTTWVYSLLDIRPWTCTKVSKALGERRRKFFMTLQCHMFCYTASQALH